MRLLPSVACLLSIHPLRSSALSSSVASSSFTPSSPMSSPFPPAVIRGAPSWQQTMLRVSDPSAALAFYRDKLGMTVVDQLDFPALSFSLTFLASLNGEAYPHKPGSDEAHRWLWSHPGATLELTHNHGAPRAYHAGNGEGEAEGRRGVDGFGHVCFHVDDVYATADRLAAQGVSFKKKPDEGRMKGLAFARDADGYWVELVKRAKGHGLKQPANLSQTMLRIKDPARSIPFYQSLGLTVVSERHFGPDKGAFSLFFLANLSPSEAPPAPGASEGEVSAFVNKRQQPFLELTHNHGTEGDAGFGHFNGNEAGRQGFGEARGGGRKRAIRPCVRPFDDDI